MVSTRQMTTITSSSAATSASAAAAAAATATASSPSTSTAAAATGAGTPWFHASSSSSSHGGEHFTLPNNTTAATAGNYMVASNHANTAMPSPGAAAFALAPLSHHSLPVGVSTALSTLTATITDKKLTANAYANVVYGNGAGPSTAGRAASTSNGMVFTSASSSSSTYIGPGSNQQQHRPDAAAGAVSMTILRHVHPTNNSASTSNSNNTASSSSSFAATTNRGRPAMACVAATRMLPPSNILELPMEMLEEIFSYVGYKKVSQMRLVRFEMLLFYFTKIAIFTKAFFKCYSSLNFISMFLSFAGIQINEYGLQCNSEFDLLEIVHLPEQSLSQDQEQHAETVSTSRVLPTLGWF